MEISEALYETLVEATSRPQPFEHYTAADLWTDEHTSQQMLKYHLDEHLDLSSRNHAFIDRSVSWIADRFSIDSETEIADFGCGPGLYTTRFGRLGPRVTGIDFSSRSIEYAKAAASREGLAIHYVHDNYLEFDSDERFDLITLIFCDYCALSPTQRQALLGKFRDHLRPGGSILLDVHSLAAFQATRESSACERDMLDGFWSSDEYVAISNVFKYDDEKVILHKYTIAERRRIRRVYNWLQHFDVSMLEEELERNGLVLHEVYADVAGTPYAEGSSEIAIVAGVKE